MKFQQYLFIIEFYAQCFVPTLQFQQTNAIQLNIMDSVLKKIYGHNTTLTKKKMLDNSNQTCNTEEEVSL